VKENADFAFRSILHLYK